MRELSRVNTATRIAGLLSGLTLAFTVHGADGYNDEVPVGRDLEPPIPRSTRCAASRQQ